MVVIIWLLLTCLPSAFSVTLAPMVLTTNPYFYSYRYWINVNNITNGDNETTLTYICSFKSTVKPIQSIFYTTQSIDNDVINTPSPYHPKYRTVKYTIATVDYSTTHLTTSISGHVTIPLMLQMALQFLLVLDDNPLIPSYMAIQQVTFNRHFQSKETPLPSLYQDSDTLNTLHMLSYCQYRFTDTDYFINGYDLYFRVYTHRNNLTNSSSVVGNRLYLDSILTEVSFTFLIINYLVSAISNDFPLLPFQFGQIYVSLTAVLLVNSTDVTFGDSNGVSIMGVSQWQVICQGTCTMFWSGEVSSDGLLIDNAPVGNLGFGAIVYEYLAFDYYECQRGYPIVVSLSDRICKSGCEDGMYYNQTANDCFPCLDTCLTCYDQSRCKSCNTSQRYLSGDQCLPYTNGTPPVTDLSRPLSNCTLPCMSCIGTPTNCTSCLITMFLNANQCHSCPNLVRGCVICTSQVCLICHTNYTLINTTYCSPVCTDPDCAVCDYDDPSLCLRCRSITAVIDANKICQPSCGDRAITKSEECDDGNVVSWDGCSEYCVVESGYECEWTVDGQGNNYTTYCAYTQAINFSVVSIQKAHTSNTITIKISIQSHQESFWRNFSSFAQYISISPLKYSNMQAAFTESASPVQSKAQTTTDPSSQMAITFDYSSSAEQNLSIGFNFTGSQQVQLSRIPELYYNIQMQSDDNQYLYSYSDQTNSLYQMLTPLYSLLAYVTIVLFVIGLVVGSGRIPADSAVVLQSAFLGLVTLDKLSPLQQAVTYISPVNYFYDIVDYTASSSMPSSMSAISLNSQFIDNYNTPISLLILPLVIGVVIFVMGRCADSQYRRQQLNRAASYLLGPTAFSVLTFSGTYIGAIATIQIKYGGGEDSSLMSLGLAVLYLVIYAIYTVAWVVRRESFGQYSFNFKSPCRGTLFRLLLFLMAPLTGASLIFNYTAKYINLYACILPSLLFILLWAGHIHTKLLDSYRIAVNLCSLILIQCVYFYYRIDTVPPSDSTDSTTLLPTAIALILTTCTLTNGLWFVYEVVQNVRTKCIKMSNKAQEDEREYETVSKRFDEEREFCSRQSVMHRERINQVSPLVSLTQQFRVGFIEESEGRSEGGREEGAEKKFKEQLRRNLEAERRIESEFQEVFNRYEFTEGNYTLKDEFRKI